MEKTIRRQSVSPDVAGRRGSWAGRRGSWAGRQREARLPAGLRAWAEMNKGILAGCPLSPPARAGVPGAGCRAPLSRG